MLTEQFLQQVQKGQKATIPADELAKIIIDSRNKSELITELQGSIAVAKSLINLVRVGDGLSEGMDEVGIENVSFSKFYTMEVKPTEVTVSATELVGLLDSVNYYRNLASERYALIKELDSKVSKANRSVANIVAKDFFEENNVVTVSGISDYIEKDIGRHTKPNFVLRA